MLLGLMVFSVGFSDSITMKEGYVWLVNIWKLLNIPASYIFYYPNNNVIIYIVIQLLTSFVWANIYVLIWSKCKA